MTRRSVTTPSAERFHHHCSLRSEKNQRAVDKFITLLKKDCCQVSRCLSVMLEQGDLFSDEFGSLISYVSENPRRDSENEQIRILLERHKEQILADCRAEIQKHEFQADYDRRKIQKMNGVIESQRGEIYRALQGDEQLRRDQQLLHEQLLEQNWDLREAHEKSLNEMEELKRFRGSTFDTISRRNFNRSSRHYPWTHKHDSGATEWSLLYEWFERFSRCWISTQWTIPRYQSTSVFRTPSKSWWNAKPFSGSAEPQHWAAKYLGHAWYIGKRFCKSNGVFFSTLSARVQSVGL